MAAEEQGAISVGRPAFAGRVTQPGWLSRVAAYLYTSLARSVQYSGPRLVAVGWFGVVGFPLYYWVWGYLFPQPYENIWLRLFGSTLLLPLALSPHWPEQFRRFMPIYWYITLIYALPFFFSFMLLKNEGSQAWGLSTMVALFLAIILLDWANLILGCVAGTALAWFAYVATTPEAHFSPLIAEHLTVYLFGLVAGIIFNFTSEIVQRERLNAMLAAASTIAHELRTPLLGIRSGAAGIQRYLPIMLDAYRKAQQAQIKVEPISPRHFEAMEGVLRHIEMEAIYSNVIIDMLLVNARQNDAHIDDFVSCSAVACVQSALLRYPYASEHERAKVVWHPARDFQFRGSEILMVHVLFNLIKNALHALATSGKGEIHIWLENHAGRNELHFRDHGTGIRPDVLPHIFKRFYSWKPSGGSESGAGIGLAFCKMVMENFGGRITCRSELGQHTEFVMTFPGEA